ncbi:RbsD/FucU domain-containing protein [Carnimonas bestiolae]|uniref:RbsD/FucU domain-containing protein n=1 Tax=Carnimonas bestiolae TaxID=3402172 RepID=UPI003EDB6D13
MLTTPIIHPQVLSALASAGHKSLVVIADAHFAAATAIADHAVVVHAALQPGQPLVPEVVELVANTIMIEGLTTMQPSEPALGAVAQQVANKLPEGIEQTAVTRAEFTALTRSADVALCIVTGDTRRFANAILRVGVTPS